MTILDEINANKRVEVAEKKLLLPLVDLEKKIMTTKNSHYSMKKSLLEKKIGIISEFKRKSPSLGVINDKVDAVTVTSGYIQAGAAGVSVLTDQKYFGGSLEDLEKVSAVLTAPILRKDFMVDEYQIVEAKIYGADIILLIAASISVEESMRFAKFAKSLGLETLLEIHNEIELDHINEYIDIVGVNNRNLKTFEVNIQTSIDLSEKIPTHCLKISESGISTIDNIKVLQSVGYKGFLMGERFMKYEKPHEAFSSFFNSLNVI